MEGPVSHGRECGIGPIAWEAGGLLMVEKDHCERYWRMD